MGGITFVRAARTPYASKAMDQRGGAHQDSHRAKQQREKNPPARDLIIYIPYFCSTKRNFAPDCRLPLRDFRNLVVNYEASIPQERKGVPEIILRDGIESHVPGRSLDIVERR